jgi:hypothetical protein
MLGHDFEMLCISSMRKQVSSTGPVFLTVAPVSVTAVTVVTAGYSNATER